MNKRQKYDNYIKPNKSSQLEIKNILIFSLSSVMWNQYIIIFLMLEWKESNNDLFFLLMLITVSHCPTAILWYLEEYREGNIF